LPSVTPQLIEIINSVIGVTRVMGILGKLHIKNTLNTTKDIFINFYTILNFSVTSMTGMTPS